MAGNTYPINLNQGLSWKVRNFPSDVYNFDSADNTTTLMSILLENTGTGQLNLAQTAARLNQQNMEFSDLDNILGQLLGISRLTSEIYSGTFNPFTDQIPLSQWDDVLSKDASYRERLDGVAASYLRGATPIGFQMASEATASIPFRVVEVWRTPTVVVSGVTLVSGTNIPTRGFGQNEIILFPLNLPDQPLTKVSRTGVYNTLRNLKTVGSIVTLTSGVAAFTKLPYIPVSGTYVTSGTYSILNGNSQYFYLDRQVLGTNLTPPSYVNTNSDSTIRGRYWLQNNQPATAPYFAHLLAQESVIDVTQNIFTVNITPISTAGQPATYSATTMLANPILNITSTVYGAL